METIAECRGGCSDGVQLDPPDKSEPDDWPDYIELEDKRTGAIGCYYFRFTGRPVIRGEEFKNRFFSIVANGTADMHEEPTYAQILNITKHSLAAAESQLTAANSEIAALKAKVAELEAACSKLKGNS